MAITSQVCSKHDAQTDRVAGYMEPAPEAIGSLAEAMAAGLRIHKLIIMAAKETIDGVRPDVEQLVGERATVTQVPNDRSQSALSRARVRAKAFSVGRVGFARHDFSFAEALSVGHQWLKLSIRIRVRL